MEILVINGSPKGDYSITLQSCIYLEKKYPDHKFTYLHAGKHIVRIEKDREEAFSMIRKAELLLFIYPVYTYLVPSQLHRFMEILKEEEGLLNGKYVAQLSTSMHFYDVTAENFMKENLLDMGAVYLDGLCAGMSDMPTKEGQKALSAFFDHLLYQIRHKLGQVRTERFSGFLPMSCSEAVPVDKLETQKPVVLITDCAPEDKCLRSMIERFKNRMRLPVKEVNLREICIKGGCLGCLKCVVSEKCVYNDHFDEFLRNEIQTGRAMVVAFTIKDHSMGSLFKRYDDRQFCNGHRAVTAGMPMAYLVNGPLSEEANLSMVLHARPQNGGNILVGIASNETDPDREIDNLCKELLYAIKYQNKKPLNFYGVGGNKIFRDLVWEMRGLMKADHKFYKETGMYDFPQKQKGNTIAMYLVGLLMGSEAVRKKMGNKMEEGMLMPYKKALDELS